MKPNFLLTADLHITPKPSDEYRWKVFDRLEELVAKHGFTHVFIVGDLTEAKDCHCAALVVRLVDKLAHLARSAQVVITLGNHDYIDSDVPFFRFLTHVPGIIYVRNITVLARKTTGASVLIIPHHRTVDETIVATTHSLSKDTDLVLCHQTFKGAKSEAGRELEGVGFDLLAKVPNDTPILSGDVHTPQLVGPVRYIGAPHPVDFGDEYTPRFSTWSPEKGLGFINNKGMRKAVLRGSAGSCENQLRELNPGDLCRIIVDLPRKQAAGWDKIAANLRQIAKDIEVTINTLEPVITQHVETGVEPADVLSSATPLDLLEKFGEAHSVEDVLMKTGRRVLTEVGDK